MLDRCVERFVLESLPPAPARVLEVGAGTGELAEALTAAGHDVLAIDPASSTPTVRAIALDQLEEPRASFDAAVAVVSLHHVNPLSGSCRRLSELLRPGGILVVDEFDVDRLDGRAVRWWLAHREHAGADTPTPQQVIDELRRHCHGLSVLTATLQESFELGETTRGPYLYRWARSPELRDDEEALIADRALPRTGARLVGTRR